MTVVYMDTDDIYQLFLNFSVPGVRKEAARLAKGVNMGDAGVMGEILQAAYDPSAGQRAMQAGEAMHQPILALRHHDYVAEMNAMINASMQMQNASSASLAAFVNVVRRNEDHEAKMAIERAEIVKQKTELAEFAERLNQQKIELAKERTELAEHVNTEKTELAEHVNKEKTELSKEKTKFAEHVNKEKTELSKEKTKFAEYVYKENERLNKKKNAINNKMEAVAIAAFRAVLPTAMEKIKEKLTDIDAASDVASGAAYNIGGVFRKRVIRTPESTQINKRVCPENRDSGVQVEQHGLVLPTGPGFEDPLPPGAIANNAAGAAGAAGSRGAAIRAVEASIASNSATLQTMMDQPRRPSD
jgi:hypothetical protein